VLSISQLVCQSISLSVSLLVIKKEKNVFLVTGKVGDSM